MRAPGREGDPGVSRRAALSSAPEVCCHIPRVRVQCLGPRLTLRPCEQQCSEWCPQVREKPGSGSLSAAKSQVILGRSIFLFDPKLVHPCN